MIITTAMITITIAFAKSPEKAELASWWLRQWQGEGGRGRRARRGGGAGRRAPPDGGGGEDEEVDNCGGDGDDDDNGGSGGGGQGDRSCTGARVAPAKKFGLGRKF